MNKVPVCPICGEKVTKFMVTDSDKPGQPEEPGFWGVDDRAIIHQEGAWCHFRVGKDRGRLAYLRGVIMNAKTK